MSPPGRPASSVWLLAALSVIMHFEDFVSLFLHLGTYTPTNDVHNTFHSDTWPFTWIPCSDVDHSRLIAHDAINIGMWLWLNVERALNDSTCA